ncbi:cytochrome c biogenesis protein CcsA [Nannocystis sp. SCPEA4]|jgi:ABC-type uncharacterized transport system permease subunit|uniref:cytochrome c biogenesis protein CcsA n=1 Tax=Nannocystis sp. SCPEA4 TaxID=2996787 RepID=UPI00226ED456|nr:cytochrome c biogenesis protein CcsA [Nannocystis sp. SCPEA4]MCY1057752.1 cytochrome c biogenesis protein CcsA [Nannocystis sp. SCPEA4]
MLVLFILASLAYGAAIFAYALDPPAGEAHANAKNRETRAAILLAIAAALHVACIGAQCVAGEHPFGSVFLATSFGALIAVVGALVVGRIRRAGTLGAIVAPVGLLGLSLGVMFGATGVHDPLPAPTGALAKAHIGLATAGLGGFTVAAGIAALYLTMDRRLRLKRWKPQPGGLSLTGLERLHYHAVMLVAPVLTLTIVTGVLWTVKSGGVAAIGGRWIEVLMAAAAWLCSAAILVMRATLGVRGRKSALLTLAAFACTLLVLVWYGVRA